jgi:hypothetical protein
MTPSWPLPQKKGRLILYLFLFPLSGFSISLLFLPGILKIGLCFCFRQRYHYRHNRDLWHGEKHLCFTICSCTFARTVPPFFVTRSIIYTITCTIAFLGNIGSLSRTVPRFPLSIIHKPKTLLHTTFLLSNRVRNRFAFILF